MGDTDGTVDVDSCVVEVSLADCPTSEKTGTMEMVEAVGIPAGTELVVDLAGFALLAADTPLTGGGEMNRG